MTYVKIYLAGRRRIASVQSLIRTTPPHEYFFMRNKHLLHYCYNRIDRLIIHLIRSKGVNVSKCFDLTVIFRLFCIAFKLN